jgi:hypothetical protein
MYLVVMGLVLMLVSQAALLVQLAVRQCSVVLAVAVLVQMALLLQTA